MKVFFALEKALSLALYEPTEGSGGYLPILGFFGGAFTSLNRTSDEKVWVLIIPGARLSA